MVRLAWLLLTAAAEVVQVHIVCHTHDDVGWLKTVDEYYTGQNNSIQQPVPIGFDKELRGRLSIESQARLCAHDFGHCDAGLGVERQPHFHLCRAGVASHAV